MHRGGGILILTNKTWREWRSQQIIWEKITSGKSRSEEKDTEIEVYLGNVNCKISVDEAEWKVLGAGMRGIRGGLGKEVEYRWKTLAFSLSKKARQGKPLEGFKQRIYMI
jgi:hypothetical protein